MWAKNIKWFQFQNEIKPWLQSGGIWNIRIKKNNGNVEHHNILNIKDVIQGTKAFALVSHSVISLLRPPHTSVVQKSMLKHNLLFRFINYTADARLSTEISIACECCSLYTLQLCRHKYAYSQETTLFMEHVTLEITRVFGIWFYDVIYWPLQICHNTAINSNKIATTLIHKTLSTRK